MALAARGARNLDTGVEKIDDGWTQAQLRRQARKVYLESVGTGALLTLLIAVIPNLR